MKQFTYKSHFFALLTALLSASSAQAIVGGTHTSSFGQVSNGVQVSANWVITARHIGLSVGSTFSNGYGSAKVAARYEVPGTGAWPMNDLALLRLDHAIAAPSLSLLSDTLNGSSPYKIDATIVSGRNAPQRAYGWTEVRAFYGQYDDDGAGPKPAVAVNWLETYLDGHLGPVVQGGDSGGALFKDKVTGADAGQVLWGITSALNWEEPTPGQKTNFSSLFVQLGNYRSWIDGTMAADTADAQTIQWVSSVPEPSTYALMGLGLLALAARTRRKA